MEAMTKLFGREIKAWIEPPFYYCYGTNITIGDNCWVGVGSVVVHDIPANVVAVGNPCKVLREINETDKKYYYKDREFSEADLEEERSLR